MGMICETRRIMIYEMFDSSSASGQIIIFKTAIARERA
jgi:hypothetical protein